LCFPRRRLFNFCGVHTVCALIKPETTLAPASGLERKCNDFATRRVEPGSGDSHTENTKIRRKTVFGFRRKNRKNQPVLACWKSPSIPPPENNCALRAACGSVDSPAPASLGPVGLPVGSLPCGCPAAWVPDRPRRSRFHPSDSGLPTPHFAFQIAHSRRWRAISPLRCRCRHRRSRALPQ